MIGRFSLSVAFAVAAATVAAAQTSPTSLCVNKQNGAVRLMSSDGCRQNERLITFTGGPAGPPGPVGPAGPPGPPGAGNFRVNDSRGNLVGFAVGFDRVARLIGGRWTLFEVKAEGFLSAQSGGQQRLFYSTADCSGTAYLLDLTPFDPAGLTPDGQFAFVGRELVQVAVVTSNTNTELGNCFTWPPRVVTVRRAEVIDMSSLGLVPPFSVAR